MRAHVKIPILALTLALLAPFFTAFSLLGAQRTSCEMSCCKKSKAKSCHNDSKPDIAWTSVPDCKKSCGQRGALPGSIAAALVAGASDSGPVSESGSYRLPENPARDRAGAAFALFERPPPRSL